MGYFIPDPKLTGCPCCGGTVETIHPLQVIGTLVLGLVAWLIYAIHRVTK